MVFAASLIGGTVARADDSDPARLLRWVPADANAVAIIDVAGLFHSPLALREHWRKQADDRFANQEISVPPEARRVVMASQVDLGQGLQPVWELGILELERTPSFALIARREGGHLDTIAGHSGIRTSSGRYGVELEPGLLLGTAQPNRQIISRWVASIDPKGAPRLSPFLTQAIDKADRKAHLVMALDLVDSLTAAPIREILATYEPLKGKTSDQADIAEILASVQGVVLTVHVSDKREGAVRVDFKKPTAIMKPIAKSLMEEVLRGLGISLADFDHWTATTSGTSLVLNGDFSAGDLRRVVSLFAASPAAHQMREPETGPSAGTTAPDPMAAKAEISKKYFHSVRNLVDELNKTLHKTRDNHNVWMERYARKIDDLPIKDVDTDLLTFGGNVSNSLRYQSQAGRMAALRSGVREAQPNYAYATGGIGPYGSYGNYSYSVRVAPESGRIRTEEHANAAQVKVSEMKQIEDGMVQIRRAMTAKYNVEF